jgi:3-hydroxyisobutyrate dehydrogenase
MGSGIAQNLVRAGFPVTVYNRTPARAQALLEAGARWAESPAEAARGADVALSVVADDRASRAIWLGAPGAAGALETLGPGAWLIECSTLSAPWLRELQQRASERGIEALDAPLAGSKAASQAGQLTVLVGAAPAALEAVRPVLAAFASTIAHLGPPGAGLAYKLIHNQLVAVHVAALGEAVAMARGAGLDLGAFARILASGAAGSPVVKAKLDNVVAGAHADVHFALSLMLKDTNYAAALAEALGVPTPLGSAAREQFARAAEQGLGDLDFAAVTRLWLAG